MGHTRETKKQRPCGQEVITHYACTSHALLYKPCTVTVFLSLAQPLLCRPCGLFAFAFALHARMLYHEAKNKRCMVKPTRTAHEIHALLYKPFCFSRQRQASGLTKTSFLVFAHVNHTPHLAARTHKQIALLYAHERCEMLSLSLSLSHVRCTIYMRGQLLALSVLSLSSAPRTSHIAHRTSHKQIALFCCSCPCFCTLMPRGKARKKDLHFFFS